MAGGFRGAINSLNCCRRSLRVTPSFMFIKVRLWISIQCVLPLQVSQIGLYGGFIENYEKAVEVVRKCTNSDVRFRTLAEVLKALH